MSIRERLPYDNAQRNHWGPVGKFSHEERGTMKLQMNDTLHFQIRTGLTE